MKKCQMSKVKCQMSNARLAWFFSTVQSLISFITPISLIPSQQGFIKFTKRALVSYLIISIVFFGTGLIYLFNPFGTGSVDAAWFNDDWAYRKAITIDESMVSGSSNLTNFPVLVSLASDTALADKAQDDGDDIVFTAINGDRLSHEIEKFDGSTGELVAWVRVPSLSATSNTILYIYFGNPGVSNQQRPTDVWEASYQVVQHMEETSTSDTTNTDSTSNKNDAIKETANRPTPATGQIAGSQDKSISALGNDWYINNAAPPSGTQDYTISFWVDPNNAGNYNAIHWGNNGSDVATFAILLVATTGRPRLAYNQSTVLNATTDMNGAGYYHVVLTRSGNTHTFYVNGAAAGTASSSTSLTFSGNCPMHLANSWSSSDCVNNANTTNSMALDEFKYALGTAKSADWIATEYNNQSNPGSYITTGSEEKGPTPISYWKLDDAQGTSAQDSTTNNKDITLAASTSTPTWQTEDQCIAGKCLYFDGSNDYASATPTIPTGDFTYSAWVYSLDNSDDMIFMASDGSTSNEFAVHLASTKVRINIDNVSVMNTTNIFPTNTWTHLAVTRSGSTITVYVNGSADPTTGSSGTTLNFSTCELLIGVDADSGCNGSLGNHFKGKIDEIKVYNQALSASQIKSNFDARSNLDAVASQNGNNIQNLPGALSDGLVGYWKMDESSWTVDCSTTSVTDSSGNGQAGKSCPSSTGPTGGATGKFAYGGLLDGNGDGVNVADSTILDIGSNNITLSQWFKRTGNSNFGDGSVLIDKNNGNTTAGYKMALSNNGNCNGTDGSAATKSICFIVSDGTNSYVMMTSAIITADSIWHHVSAVFDRTNPNKTGIYLDGVKLSTTDTGTASNVGSIASANGLGIGRDSDNLSSTSGTFNGSLDETRIYSRSLSPAEVSQLYNWAPGPVGYWKLDERTGGSAYDASGYANNGTLGSTTATPSWANGKYGSALSYDGGDTVSVSDSSSLSLTGNFSLAAWVNVPNLSGYKPAVTKENSGQTGYFLYISDDEVYTGYGNGAWRSQTTSTSPITANTWIHIASTFNGTTLTTYVNGVSVQSSAPGGSVSDNSSDLGIGNASDLSSMYTGLIDEAKVYNYPRTAEQIKADMNAGHPAPGSPVGTPLGYWRFDEGYSTTANNVGSLGNSGSTYTGTLTNMSSPATSTSGWTNNGKFGKGLLFDGTNDRVDYSDMTILEGISQATWSMWVNPTSLSTSQGILVKANNASTAQSWAIMTDASDSTAVRVRIATGGTDVSTYGVTPTGALANGRWTHIEAVFDGTGAANTDRLKIYINGTPQTLSFTGTIPSTLQATTSIMRFSGWSDAGGSYFNGAMDELKIYTQSLTESQVKMDFNRSQSEVLGALSDSSTAGSDNTSTRTAQSNASQYCIPGDSSTCTGPSGEWMLDEGSGTAANDSSGNGGTGTITAGTGKYTNGKINKSYQFDGTDTLINAGSGSPLDNLPASGMTAEAWIYPTGAGEGNAGFIMAKNNGNSQNAGWLFLTLNTGGPTKALQFVIDGSTDLVKTTSDNVYSYNTWNHVAVTSNSNFSAGSVHIYVNGKEVSYSGSSGGSSRVSDAASSFYIGNASSSDRTFAGIIDQVKVFNYERTPAQIAWDYNQGKPIAHWKMDECQGTTINDMSGNNMTGTLTIGGTGGNTTAGTCTSSGAWFDGVTGKKNYSIDFDGTDDYISGSDVIFPDGTEPSTMSLWFKTNGTCVDDVMFVYGTNSTGQARGLTCLSATSIKFFGWSSDFNYTVPSTTTDWHHVLGVFDGTSAIIYFDGKLIGSNSATWNTVLSGTYYIGRNIPSSHYFPGQIDDVRIYNYPLTATQVKTLYNEGAYRVGPATGAP